MNGRKARQRRRIQRLIALPPRLQFRLDQARRDRDAAILEVRRDYFRALKVLEAKRVEAERDVHRRFLARRDAIYAEAIRRGETSTIEAATAAVAGA